MISGVVMLLLEASLALAVFGVGLRARLVDLGYVVRHPAFLGRTLLSINVIMPIIALAVATVFALDPPVKLALVALAMSPIPPFLPLTIKRVPGDPVFAVGLPAVESVVAIAFVPLTLLLLDVLPGKMEHQAPAVVARIIVVTGILIPLVAGAAVRQALPWFAERLAKPVSVIAMLALVAGFIPLVGALWRPMLSLIGNGDVVAIVTIALAGLGIGHVLGGPVAADRPVLALATSSRHPAVAIAILASTFPAETLAPAAVMLAVIATSLASLPYSRWAQRELEAAQQRPNILLISPVRRPAAPTPGSPQRPAAAVPVRRPSDRSS